MSRKICFAPYRRLKKWGNVMSTLKKDIYQHVFDFFIERF